jgi:dolichol-phosphate mannosyltransferase
VPALIDELCALLTPVLGDGYELLVVDDDSPDLTWQIALNVAASRPCGACCAGEASAGFRPP